MIRRVVGVHACEAALKVRAQSVKVFYVKRSKKPQLPHVQSLIDLAQKSGVKVLEKEMGFFDKIAQTHQGVCLEVSESPSLDWEKLESKEKSVLVFLDELEDPHNLGAILRTGWLLGVDGVFVTSRRSASLTPSAAKVASGAAEYVPVVELNNFTATLKELKEMGYWVYGLSEKTKTQVNQVEFSDKVVLIVGAEGKGLRKSTQGLCDELITIPQTMKEASLNASVAASIAIYEASKSNFAY